MAANYRQRSYSLGKWISAFTPVNARIFDDSFLNVLLRCFRWDQRGVMNTLRRL